MQALRLGFAVVMIAGAGDVTAALPPPNKPLSGTLHGRAFRLDRATLEDGGLELRQGTNFFADVSVKIYLNPKEGESLEGKVYKVGGDKKTGFSSVQVHLKWVEKEDDLPKTEMFGSDEFSLALEFGKRVNYNMPGKISLTLKDKMKSHLEGTFTIGPTDDESAWGALISGKILLKGGTNGLAKALGSAGKTIGVTLNTFELGPDGKVEGPGAGLSIDGRDGGYTCASWRPRNSTILCDKTGTITHRQVNRPPGHNLVMLRGTAREPAKENETAFGETEYDGCLDWKWLVIKDAKERINLDLTLDPGALGKLAVSVTNAPPRAWVSYMPLDPTGNLPLPDALTYYGSPRRKLVNGKVEINWLKEGKYRLLPVLDYMDDMSKNSSQAGSVDVEIKRGVTSKVDLKWPEKSDETATRTVPPAQGITPREQASSSGRELRIRAFIDGSDVVKVRDNELWYMHKSDALPGKWDGNNKPTYVNKKEWTPEWEGNTSRPFESVQPPFVPKVGTKVAIIHTYGRGKASIVEQPNEKNNQTLSIQLDDPDGGADWLEVVVRW